MNSNVDLAVGDREYVLFLFMIVEVLEMSELIGWLFLPLHPG